MIFNYTNLVKNNWQYYYHFLDSCISFDEERQLFKIFTLRNVQGFS